MTAAVKKVVQLRLPTHEFSGDHQLAKAVAQYATKKRLAAVADLQSSGEVAAQRIREFAYDIGAEIKHARGWKARMRRAKWACPTGRHGQRS